MPVVIAKAPGDDSLGVQTFLAFGAQGHLTILADFFWIFYLTSVATPQILRTAEEAIGYDFRQVSKFF